jgi:hypothetical protein
LHGQTLIGRKGGAQVGKSEDLSGMHSLSAWPKVNLSALDFSSTYNKQVIMHVEVCTPLAQVLCSLCSASLESHQIGGPFLGVSFVFY